MMKHFKLHLLILICTLPLLHGCEKYPQNPNRPILPYPVTVHLNDIHYSDLYPISGWVYITPPPECTSRGFIVFHSPDPDNEFIAYDRMPPNYPDACETDSTPMRLVVDGGWVIDRCNNAYYTILNGELIVSDNFDMIPNFPTDSGTVYPLIRYHTTFDGNKLVISN